MTALAHGPLTPGQQADLRTVQLPDRLVIGKEDRRSDFEQYVRGLVTEWTASGRISNSKSGFGFATSGVVTSWSLSDADLEDPSTYISTAFTNGDVPVRYLWNAVRKIYEMLRLVQQGQDFGSTLEAVQSCPEVLRPAVLSENPDGTVPWGPFSYGGAVILYDGSLATMCAFSVWKQEEDDDVARHAAQWLLRQAH